MSSGNAKSLAPETELSRRPYRAPAWMRALLNFCAVPGRCVSLLILLHLGITVTLAYRLGIWIDEAFTLHTTGRGVAYAFSQAINFELQPPLYFVLLDLWRTLNGSIFFARLFSVLCVALTIKTASILAQRLWKEVHPGWVAALLAVHPFTIWAAMEIRVYALVILLTALLLLLFFDGYLAEADSSRARWLYLLVSILALYTYYYLGFILVAGVCALILLRRWRLLRFYLASMLAVGLCFAPMTLIVLGQITTHTRPLKSMTPWWEGIKFLSWRVKEYILPAEETSLLSFRRWILRFAYVLTILFVARQPKRSLTTANVFVWIITIITSLLFLAALHATSEEMMMARHTAVLFLPSILLAFSVIFFISGGRRLWVGVLVMLVFNVVSLQTTYKFLVNGKNWDQVASYLMTQEKPGQTILVFYAGNALPLSYYYKGPNTLLPIPRENRFETYDIRDYVLRDEQEIFDALARVPGGHDELWLVTDEWCSYLGVDYNCPVLEEFVDKYYAVESSQTFSRIRVRFLRRKAR